MRKVFLMQPRQSGKTTKAVYEFLKDQENTIFVTLDSKIPTCIKDKSKVISENFISSKIFVRGFGRLNCKNIILDEYMYFKNKDEVYRVINEIGPKNVYIFSTSDKCYNKKIFDFVKEKKNNLLYQELLNYYGKDLTDNIKQEIYDLYYNFLTDDDTILIDFDFSTYMRDNSHSLKCLGKDRGDIEINNIYLYE